MKLVTIRRYEMISLSRWAWHTFRKLDKNTGLYSGKVLGFRFLGLGISWGGQWEPVMPDHVRIRLQAKVKETLRHE